jgi:hypothetical protein
MATQMNAKKILFHIKSIRFEVDNLICSNDSTRAAEVLPPAEVNQSENNQHPDPFHQDCQNITRNILVLLFKHHLSLLLNSPWLLTLCKRIE